MLSRRAREICKAVGWKVAPGIMPQVMQRRAADLARKHGTLEIGERILEKSGAVVQAGPFKGMRYLRQSVGSVLAPKMLGCYEEELHETFEAVCTQSYEIVYDVGSAEGYYAVGLAMRLPGNPRVIGFDIDPYAKLLCAELARLNSVKVEISGFCGPEQIAALKGKRALVLSDCEGYEFTLLAGEAPKYLEKSDLIVELHGPAEELLESFRPTHDLKIVTERARDPDKYPLLDGLTADEKRIAVSEMRGRTTPWAFLKSKYWVG